MSHKSLRCRLGFHDWGAHPLMFDHRAAAMASLLDRCRSCHKIRKHDLMNPRPKDTP